MELTGVNQLWVADITYIRLRNEFVYLAVVLDGYSRKVVGWARDRTLAARLAMEALTDVITQRQPPPGLVHHSDRGVQYAASDYVGILKKHQMLPSMSRPANPYDNANLQNPQARRDLCQSIHGSGSLASPHRGVHPTVLQLLSAAFRFGVLFTGGIRAGCSYPRTVPGSKDEFLEAWEDLSIR